MPISLFSGKTIDYDKTNNLKAHNQLLEKIQATGGYIVIESEFDTEWGDEDYHFYSMIFGKLAAVERWRERLIKGPSGGNIYIKLTDGRIIPVYDDRELTYYNRVCSKDAKAELDKYSYKSSDYDYWYRDHFTFYSARDDEDIAEFNRIMEKEEERREKDKKDYERRMAIREAEQLLYQERADQKAKEEAEKLKEAKKKLDKMFGD